MGRELIGFDDQTWRYIQVERYWLPRGSPATRVTSGVGALRLLMAHPRYRSDYLGEQPPAGDPLVHGPYRLDHLSIDTYEIVDEQTALDTIAVFAKDDEERALSDDVRADIDFRVIRQIRKMPIRYRLRSLPEEAIGESAHYQSLGDYTELVLVDLKANELLLVTAAWD